MSSGRGGIRPMARMGAQDSTAVFDASVCDARKNFVSHGKFTWYPQSAGVADESILEHEILLTRKDAGRETDKAARVFSSLNGVGEDIGIDAQMEEGEAQTLMRNAFGFGGLAVTDFVRQQGAYAPDEGAAFTVTHAGLNTVYSPSYALRPGQLVSVEFPSRLETRKLRSRPRRGAPASKVTAVPRPYDKRDVGRRVKETIAAHTRNTRGPAFSKRTKIEGFARTIRDTYLMGGIELIDAIASTTNSANFYTAITTALGSGAPISNADGLRKYLGVGNESAVGGVTARGVRSTMMANITGDHVGTDAHAKARATHMGAAVSALVDAVEDDRRWIIGKVVQGCKKEGYATIALGVSQ